MNDAWWAINSAADVLKRSAAYNYMAQQRRQVQGVDTFIFRPAPSGILTKMHYFMFVGMFPPGWATVERMSAFTQEAVGYSIDNKGGLTRGAQTGTATVAVILTDRVAPRAAGWATKPHGNGFAALSYPVTVELAESRITYPKYLVVGAVYSRALNKFVKKNVVEPLYPNGGYRR